MAPEAPNPGAAPLKLSPARIPSHRRSLPTTWARYIPGDYTGLYQLAGVLYKFAETSNSYMMELAGHVNRLIAGNHEKWRAYSTNAFKQSYGQDALIMNGLGHTVAAVARIVDTLAERLALLEQRLERELEDNYAKGYIVHNGLGPAGPDFKPNPKYVNSPNKSDQALVARVMTELHQHRDEALVEAARYRNAALGEMIIACRFISSGFKYYIEKAGASGSLDPTGLLSKEQIAGDKVAADRLTRELDQQAGVLAQSGLDLKLIGQDLQKGGEFAQQIGDIASQVPPAAKLGMLLQEGGNIASQVGPIIASLGGK